MTPHEQFISNLIRIRIDKNITKRETAARCRINYEKYEKIEQGECDITIGLLHSLSRGLDVNFFELMGIDVYQIPRFSCYESFPITEDMDEAHTYGIAVCCQATMIPATCDTFTFLYSDLTAEKDALVSLVDLMNREQLGLIHVEDVIEDFLV